MRAKKILWTCIFATFQVSCGKNNTSQIVTQLSAEASSQKEAHSADEWIAEDVDASYLKDLKNAIGDVKRLLPENFLPAQLTYYIMPFVDLMARFEPLNRIIYSFVSGKDFPLLGKAVLLHEFGHAVFENALPQAASSFSAFHARNQERYALFGLCKFFEFDRKSLIEEIQSSKKSEDHVGA